MHCDVVSVSTDNSDSRSVHCDMYMALLERRQILEQQLSRKLQQLRKICLQEAVCSCNLTLIVCNTDEYLCIALI